MGKIERGVLDGSGYESWMYRRQDQFCDEIEPAQVYVVDGENVVWAQRQGISGNGYFNFFHIGCDHLGDVPQGESEIEAMIGCAAVQKVLFETAAMTADNVFHLKQIIPEFIYEEREERYLDVDGERLAERFIHEALIKTIEKPEICQGNIRTAMHIKPVLQYMLGGVAETQVEILADKLESKGLASHDGPFISLAA